MYYKLSSAVGGDLRMVRQNIHNEMNENIHSDNSGKYRL
jgi:hypothetical protein